MTSSGPHTRTGLAVALRELGAGEGDTLLVHSSLRSVGFVVGGALAVVQALLDVVGPAGTLVVPTFTSDNGDPKRWALTCGRAVPPQWWPTIREHLPAFDPLRTPSVNVGAVAEMVRTWPGAVRSAHPQTSFAALGPAARELTAGHDLDCHLGARSPLGRLADPDRKARVLLLGVPFGVCTAFHLAEYQLPDLPLRDYECVIAADGERRWHTFCDVALSAADFDLIGAALEASAETGGLVRRGRIGDADSRLLPLPEAVGFARTWLRQNRSSNAAAGRAE